MINTTLTGRRCRATKEIRSYQGTTGRFTEGTIQYDLDNIGRHLFSVRWDNGVTGYVFPLEIEIIDEEASPSTDVAETWCGSLVESNEPGETIVVHGEIKWN